MQSKTNLELIATALEESIPIDGTDENWDRHLKALEIVRKQELVLHPEIIDGVPYWTPEMIARVKQLAKDI